MKIKIKDIEYEVIPEQRIVKCTGSFLFKSFSKYAPGDYNYLYDSIITNRCYPHIKATGVAVCSPNDSFDVNIGKKIACAKMRLKIYNKLYKIISRANKDIDELKHINIDNMYKVYNNRIHTYNFLFKYNKKIK